MSTIQNRLDALQTRIQMRRWEIWDIPLYRYWIEEGKMSYQDVINQDPMINYYYKSADRLAKILSYAQRIY